MILQDAVERRFYTQRSKDGDKSRSTTFYSDIPLGVYVIRGDSMVILGSVSDHNVGQQVPLEELEKMQKQDTPTVDSSGATTGGPLTWDFDTDLIA